jgi:hypothetical protein
MRAIRMKLATLFAGLLAAQGLLMPASGQNQPDPVDALFQPLAPAPSAQTRPGGIKPGPPGSIVPTVLPDGSTGMVVRPNSSRRTLGPRRPPFELREGDRVLFLGDSLLEQEAAHGFLETRMTSQYPDRNITFRNLSGEADIPLAAAPSATNEPAKWLPPLLTRIGGLKPNVVVVGYGAGASAGGEEGLASFKTNYIRLLDGIKALSTNQPRFVLLTPVAPAGAAGPGAETNQLNQKPSIYAQAIRELATNHTADLIDVFEFTRQDAANAQRRAEATKTKLPPLTEPGPRLTPYGCWRVTFLMERDFRWPPNTWRFGLRPDNSFREQGFGVRFIEHRRTDTNVVAVTLEDRLPTPNPAGYVELDPSAKPHCYIQIPAFKPGRYAYKVDDKQVFVGTDTEWARFEVIAQGPQWEQAEQLRQAIVKKNEAYRAACKRRDKPAEAASSSEPNAAASPDADPAVVEWEGKIKKLRKPVVHTLEVVQIEAGASQPAGPSSSPPGTAPATGSK